MGARITTRFPPPMQCIFDCLWFLFSDTWCAGTGPIHGHQISCSGRSQSGSQWPQNVSLVSKFNRKTCHLLNIFCLFWYLHFHSFCREFAVKMACALQDNSASAVHIINLSVNSIEDKGACACISFDLGSSWTILCRYYKPLFSFFVFMCSGVIALSQCLSKLPRGLSQLYLSKVSLSPKGTTFVFYNLSHLYSFI